MKIIAMMRSENVVVWREERFSIADSFRFLFSIAWDEAVVNIQGFCRFLGVHLFFLFRKGRKGVDKYCISV